MKTPLVLLNLLHQPVRSLVAVLGVAFAVLLVFMQLGFYGSAETAANTLYHALDFRAHSADKIVVIQWN